MGAAASAPQLSVTTCSCGPKPAASQVSEESRNPHCYVKLRTADSDPESKRLGWSSLSTLIFNDISCCCCSIAQSCPTLCDPMDCSTPCSLSFTISRSLLKLTSIKLMMPSNHLILCHPLLLLLSVFPSIKVFPAG